MTATAATAPRRPPIKTLHITNYFHASSGGIRTFYLSLLEAADRHRREVRLVVPGVEDGVEKIGEHGRIYTVAAPRALFFDRRYRLLLPHSYALPYRSRLREILRVEEPDLVEVCDKYTLSYLPSVLRRGWIGDGTPPVVIGLSCERMDDNVSAFLTGGGVGRRFANWYMKHVYAPRFDGYISNSEYTASEVNEALRVRDERPSVVCPMGVNVEGFGPHLRDDSARRCLHAGFPANVTARPRRILLYVGRISPEKNPALLVETMERLMDDSAFEYCMAIAGSGPRERWLSATAEARVPGRIRLLGQIGDREQLAQLYANCDALVHPNPREPFGIVPLEAMASGLPVVAPRRGGVLSYANEDNAWLAEPSGEAFADAVRNVFTDHGTRAGKISNALQTARAFSWPNVTARFFALYDDLYYRLRHPAPPPASELGSRDWDAVEPAEAGIRS